MGLLPADRIHALYAAAVACGLASQQDALLAGLPAAYTATLPSSGPQAARLLQTLHALNEVPALADGMVPLAVWLRAAITLSGGRQEQQTFKDALREIGGVASGAATSSLAAAAPTEGAAQGAEAPNDGFVRWTPFPVIEVDHTLRQFTVIEGALDAAGRMPEVASRDARAYRGESSPEPADTRFVLYSIVDIAAAGDRRRVTVREKIPQHETYKYLALQLRFTGQAFAPLTTGSMPDVGSVGDAGRGSRASAVTTVTEPARNHHRPARVFVSYARVDAEYRRALSTHLATLRTHGLISDWHDGEIVPGEEWDAKIRAQLEAADIIVLLLSADFFASEYINRVEIPHALERHEAGTARVVPVVVRAVEWKHTPLARIQGLPENGKAVKSWSDQDEAWANVVAGIRRVIEGLWATSVGVPTEARITTALPTFSRTTAGSRFVGAGSSLGSADNGFASTYYQVGRVRADVWLGLLGGGDRKYGVHEILFRYKHERVPLPRAIEADRAGLEARLLRAAEQAGRVFFNGPAVRLHSIDLRVHQAPSGQEIKEPHIELRPTCWFDYAISNQRLDEPAHMPGRGLMTLRGAYADINKLLLHRNVDWVQLSNILTISIVLVSSDRWTLVGRRTQRVDNHDSILATSAAENMHRWKDEPSTVGDFWSPPNGIVAVGNAVTAEYAPRTCPNPFFTTVRAIREEIGEEAADAISRNDVHFLAVAWDLGHFNPHLYCVVNVGLSALEIRRILAGARGDDSWESDLILVPFEPAGLLKQLLVEMRWAEVSKGAILRALVNEFGYRDVNRSLS